MPTRRQLIQTATVLGGFRAGYLTLQALGLVDVASPAAAQPLRLDERQRGKTRAPRVAILGAGMAGLSAAYELDRAGYDCTVIEARDRVGGRNWSVRRDTTVEMTDGSRQRCGFDQGQYWNAGPARLPSHHQAILGYCRELGVPLEVEVNTNRSARLFNPRANGGKPIEMRQVANDARGVVAELLGKALSQGALDGELTLRDRDRMTAFLRTYGDLGPDLRFEGTSRSGYVSLPGAAEALGARRDPVAFSDLLDVDLWTALLFEEAFDFQATMFQPVGGMDRIPAAFARKLGDRIRLRREVTAIRRNGDGVRVVTRAAGRAGRIDETIHDADVCLITIPLKVLAGIEADFSPPVRAAIAAVEYGNAVKIAWQSRRFWEIDDHIYGGISWVKGQTALVWYPSERMFSDKGILLGGYAARDTADALAARPLAEQFELSRAMVEGLHPGHGHELEHPMAIAWSKVPYSLGISARLGDGQAAEYALLNQPDGPFYFAGEHLAHIGAWQEGAILSARRAINAIDARCREQVCTTR